MKDFALRFRNAMSDRARTMLGIRPPFWVRPWRRGSAVSDLFPWRVDENWQTRFDLMNLSSLLLPDRAMREDVGVVFFDAGGRRIGQEFFRVEPFEVKTLQLADFVSGGVGGFSCFHTGENGEGVDCGGGHVVERNYLSFRRRGDNTPVWAYVHGNTYAFARGSRNGFVRSIAGRPQSTLIYRPQMAFDDCNSFDLVFSNTTSHRLDVEVRCLDATRRVVRTERTIVSGYGVAKISVDNRARDIVMVENHGAHFMWRPVVFKFYETGFDVLHS